MSALFDQYARSYEQRRETVMSLSQYLDACRTDPILYAGPHERLLAAIGEPEMVDTSQDSRLGRIFQNRTIRTYKAFPDFYGMEETVERMKHARRAQQRPQPPAGRLPPLKPPMGGVE